MLSYGLVIGQWNFHIERTQTPPASHGDAHKAFVFLVLMMLLGAGLRSLAARTDFWFDEAWSWWFVTRCTSVADVFTGHHPNNHYLNSLWIYLTGISQRDWRIYRLPSIIAGVASIWLLNCIARHSRSANADLQAYVVTVLSAVSYILVIYGSEARGYSPAIFFSLLAVDRLQQYFDHRSVGNNVFFCLAAIGAMLSHLSSVPILGALAVWTLYRLRQSNVQIGESVAVMSRLYLPPLAVLAGLWYCDLRLIVMGPWPFHTWQSVLYEMIGTTYGFSADTAVSALALIATIAGVVVECCRLRKRKLDIWVFYAVALLIVPTLLTITFQAKGLYPRFFVIFVPFLLLAGSGLLASMIRSAPGLAITAIALLCYCGGNIYMFRQFMVNGRGHFGEALQYMAANTPGKTFSVASPIDMQGYVLCLFYQDRQPVTKPITFVPRSGWAALHPQWLIEANQNEWLGDATFAGPEGDYQMPDNVRLPFGSYRLRRVFPYSARISGFNWCLYQRLEPNR